MFKIITIALLLAMNVQVYKVTDTTSENKLFDALENRNGALVAEVTTSTVLDNKGNGVDCLGGYIHLDKNRFQQGDKVQSIFIYNPRNNYIDDVILRLDREVE